MINKGSFLLLSLAILVFTIGSFAQTKQPKTVRDFFSLLPQEYFSLEGCETKIDKNCNKAQSEYLNRYLQVEDTNNGYMSGVGEAGQGGFEMALFKKADGKYVIGLSTHNEVTDNFYFLEYKNGNWVDVGKSFVPDYGKARWYEFPRYGKVINVFDNKITDKDVGATEKGQKLYDLEWEKGQFRIKK